MNFENHPNDRIRKAYQIAKIAHENQVDKKYIPARKILLEEEGN